MDILLMNKNWPDVKVLSQTPSEILGKLVEDLGASLHCDETGFESDDLLVIFQPMVCLSKETVLEFGDQAEPLAVKIGDQVVATFFPKGTAQERKDAQLSSGMFLTYFLPAEESFLAVDAYNTHICEEFLRERVNTRLLNSGVFISDIKTAYISPLATIEPGACILPNCQVFGKTYIGAGATLGPNTMINSSVIGSGAKINASQVNESIVGENTTVGPFAYIRPQSKIGNSVKIGDFVEIKKSEIGDGTKISHFAYIGDSEIGKNVNFSCGAITVNYDGKSKFKTRVGDGAFIGCNVNLVAPVEIGEGAFVAAGSTIIDTVPPQALSVARGRQYNKENWAKERRDSGKL